MNHSRGAISAETAASTNEPPSIMAIDHHHQQQQQHHKLHHPRLHNPHPSLSSSTVAANYQINNNYNNAGDPPLSSSSSIVDYFTKSIHQQLNPSASSSSSSLPSSLLARSLVALNNNNNNHGNINFNGIIDDQQAAAATTTVTATDIDQQQNNYYNNKYDEQSFSDWWSDYWSRQPFPSGYTQSSITLLACLITTIIFLIVVGNLLVVVAIFTEKSLKPTQNWFIASLAVSDMLLGLVVMPFSLARELMGFWIFGPLWCDIHEAIDVLLTTASINTLCLISLDRYWSITQAVNYLKKRTPKRGAFMIAFVWIFSAAVSLPPLFGWKKQSPTIIANITQPSSSSNKHKHHQHLLHHAKTTTTTTPSPLTTTTTIKDLLALDRAKRDHRRPLDRRRRRGELATPLIMTIGRNIGDYQHRQASRLIRALERPPSGSEPSVFNYDEADDVADNGDGPLNSNNNNDDDLDASSKFSTSMQRDQQLDQYANNNNNPNTINLSSATTTQQPAAGLLATPAPATTQMVTEYPSCQLSDDIGYVLYSALGSFYIPCAVMVFTYIKIFLAARSRARRAISKQSRAGATGTSSKRQAARRAAPSGNQQPPATASASASANRLTTVETSGNSVVVSTTGGGMNSHHHHHHHHQQPDEISPSSPPPPPEDGAQQQQQKQPPITKGKIVIFERKKSLAGTMMPGQKPTTNMADHHHHHQQQQQSAADLASQPPSSRDDQHQMNRATYTCSDLVNAAATRQQQQQQRQQPKQPEGNQSNEASGDCSPGDGIVEMIESDGGCTLTTSGAKQASPSALNGQSSGLSQKSSMITVMNASMAEVPVTRFNFKHHHQSPDSSIATGNDENDTEESRKAAALLAALSRASAVGDRDRQKVWSASDHEMDARRKMEQENSMQGVSEVEPNSTIAAAVAIISNDNNNNNNGDRLVVDGRVVRGRKYDEDHDDGGGQIGDDNTGGLVNTTNETCFMTIEEDSDMFDTQTGRTIMMIAGNASQRQTKNLSKAAQGGIMMTMLPPSGGAIEQQRYLEHQTSPQTVICNHVVCMRSHHQPAVQMRNGGSSYCGSSMTINDDDIDYCVDDELLTDDCNGYSISCGLDQVCSGITNCPHCQECKQQHPDEMDSMNNNTRHLSISDSPARKKLGKQLPASQQQQQHQSGPLHHHHHHHHHHNQHLQHLQQQQQQQHGRRLSEAHSYTGDDNLSLNEYRSNEDSSSVMGHDVLDATEVHKSDKRRPASSGGSSQTPIVGGRKKSSIGFRLARLGSTAPLTIHSSGLMALASNQQQQQQQQQHQHQPNQPGSRNLKALRQNFFMKLNQLTAKSVAKQQEYKNSKKMNETSPTGKSSAQSSGTSYEPSVDCPTTSNVDYQPEITAGTMDESEQQTSGEPRSSLTSKGAGELRGQTQRGSYSSGTNSSGGNNNNNNRLQKQESADQEARGANLQPGDGANTNNSSSGDNNNMAASGKSSPAGDKFKKSPGGGSGNNNNNQMIDKNDDDRALLLRDPSGAQDANKQRPTVGGGTPNPLETVASGGIGGKSQGATKLSNGKDNSAHQRSKTNSQLNHNSALPSAGGSGTTGGSTGTGTHQRAYLASDNERHKRKLAKARERRATLILGLIMAAFVCSWMPFFTFYVLRALCTVCRDYISPRFEAFIFWMGYCNSAINPIIYTIFNRDFRKAFRKILFKCL